MSDQNGDAGADASGPDIDGLKAPPGYASYNREEERARVRERVRQFVDQIQDDWCGRVPVPGKLKHNSKLDDVMKHRTLNAFRFRWFANATAFPIAMVIVFMVTAYCLSQDAFGLDFIQLEVMNSHFHGMLIALCGMLWLLSLAIHYMLYEKLGKELSEYQAAVSQISAQIGEKITTLLNNEIAVVLENTSKIKPVVAQQDDVEKVHDGIRDTMRSWRRMERLPYYLRHAWDQYFNDVMDERLLPSRRSTRVMKYGSGLLLICLLSLWSLYDAVASVSSTVTLTPLSILGLPASQVLLVAALNVFYIGYVLYRRFTRNEMFVLEIISGLMLLLFQIMMAIELTVTNWAEEPAMFLVSVTALAVVYAMVVGVGFSLTASASFKKSGDIAAARIVNALRTHKKQDVLEMFGFTHVAPYLQLLEGHSKPGEVWGGWTVLYEAERRDQLAMNGLEGHEVEVQIAIDPLIYVGETENRRIQVSKYDPVPTFLNSLPEISRNTG